jgi:hypothetical protein
MVREIVTVQLGELSNYVATHFWNTQVRIWNSLYCGPEQECSEEA